MQRHGLAGVGHWLIQVDVGDGFDFPGLHFPVDEINPPLVDLTRQPAQRSALHLDPHESSRQRFARRAVQMHRRGISGSFYRDL